jgi:hypothetical protein
VEPQEVILGEHTDYVTKGSKRLLVTKTDKFVYVPMLETLRQILCNGGVLSQMENGHHQDDVFLKDFCDGTAFKAHSIFSSDPTALQIIAYFDEVEVCNPLGSLATVHKVGVFMYTLGNIQPRYESQLKMMQFVADVNALSKVSTVAHSRAD